VLASCAIDDSLLHTAGFRLPSMTTDQVFHVGEPPVQVSGRCHVFVTNGATIAAGRFLARRENATAEITRAGWMRSLVGRRDRQCSSRLGLRMVVVMASHTVGHTWPVDLLPLLDRIAGYRSCSRSKSRRGRGRLPTTLSKDS
jgi:hypothetical protein